MERRIRRRPKFDDALHNVFDGSTHSIADVVDAWIEDRADDGVAASSIERYRLIVDHALGVWRTMGVTKMSDLDEESVNAIKRALRERKIKGRKEVGCKPSTLNTHLNVLKGFLNWFVRNKGVLRFDPTYDVDYVREPR